MQPGYWHERWREGRIGFHRAEANPLLIEHHAAFDESTRVLVPLCGKSVDLEWLVIHGFQVVGVELSELAAQAFFSERGLAPKRREQRAFVVYEHGNLAIWVGDFFATSSVDLGIFDAVYDDAALIALPAELRRSYASQLQTLIAPKAKLLLITLQFDAPGGPPFSVSPEEVGELYAAATEIRRLASQDARADTPGPIERGASFVHEVVYAVAFGRP
jgi:thiopurine S-methyltransferase